MKKQREEMHAPGRGRNQYPEAAGYTNTPRNGLSGPGRRGKLDAPLQHHQQADAGWGNRNNSDPSSSTNLPASFPRSVAQQPRHREERPLHPSWEAKKKQKEKQSAGILPPQGKKIKF